MPAFSSSTHAESFEPDPELGGEAQVFREDHDVVAGLYRFLESREPFPYEYEQNETILVLEGGVRIEVEGGPTLDLGPGDVASVVAGSRATWHIVSVPFKELFVLSRAGAASSP